MGYSAYILIAVLAYLLGSIPFGYLVVRIARGEDVRSSGSGNIGATNVARAGGKKLGILTLFLDAVKGYFAVVIAGYLATNSLLNANPENRHVVLASMSLAVLFAMIGHIFPVWLRFRGGKGVATGLGCFIALAPKAVLVVLVIFAVLVGAFHYISLASIIASAAFPVFAFLLYRRDASPAMLTATIAASLLIILKHRSNIERLVSGTENRFSFSGKKS
jgi:acyl phosphate:glycerol-3-phosphate acyltransferase